MQRPEIRIAGPSLAPETVPDQSTVHFAAITSLALLGQDYPGLRPVFAVEPGQRVRAGTLLFSDRRQPSISHVAPAAGTVRAITRGPRRSLDSLVIDTEGDEAETFAVPASLDADSVRELMLRCGLWPALRARPFGRMPDPHTHPEALFICATDTRPGAPDPGPIIARHHGSFALASQALRLLTSGPTWICTSRSADIPSVEGTRRAVSTGPHPAGLPGTHVHHLHPVERGGTVWQIGYQDVIALGHVLQSGRIWSERVISLTGAAVSQPMLFAVAPGASLRDLTAGVTAGPVRLMTGSWLDGRFDHYLARDHLQATALPHRTAGDERASLFARLASFVARAPDALVPNARHEGAAPAGILPIPFLRAIGVGNTEAARELGALALVEEDLALLSRLDGVDYGPQLRRVLDELEEAS